MAKRFDLVMMTAAWMHLDQTERIGPWSASRDWSPRRPDDSAARHGLVTVYEKERPSVFNADGVWWDVLAFRASAA